MNPVSLQGSLTGQEQNAVQNPKLVSAAHEFEASRRREFLKPLQEDPLFAPDSSGGSDPLGDLDSGSGDDQGSAGALMSFGSEALAQAISDLGGFGIATQILNHFRTANHGTNPRKQL